MRLNKNLKQQIKDKFLELKNDDHKGFLISYKNYNDGIISYAVDDVVSYNELIINLIKEFSCQYVRVLSILDLSRKYKDANISTDIINLFIDQEYEFNRSRLK